MKTDLDENCESISDAPSIYDLVLVALLVDTSGGQGGGPGPPRSLAAGWWGRGHSRGKGELLLSVPHGGRPPRGLAGSVVAVFRVLYFVDRSPSFELCAL